MSRPAFDQFVVFVSVSDLTIAHEFYTDVLGLEMVLDQGQCRIYRVAAEAYLGLCDNPETAGATGGAIITLVTDRVDEVYDGLLASGVVVDHAPAYNPRFDIYHAFVRDPDGNRIEIQQFRDLRWPRPGE